jgi:hypothetical protein
MMVLRVCERTAPAPGVASVVGVSKVEVGVSRVELVHGVVGEMSLMPLAFGVDTGESVVQEWDKGREDQGLRRSHE